VQGALWVTLCLHIVTQIPLISMLMSCTDDKDVKIFLDNQDT